MGLHDHRLLLLRHGETAWSKSGQHTSRTEQELSDDGRIQAERAGGVLAALDLVDPIVVSSPRRRTQDTAELAGLAIDAVSPLLAEWDYGAYEGLTTPEIHESDPDWLVWTHGCPDGESVAQVTQRADQAVELALDYLTARDVVFVSHGHFSRAVITRWTELPLAEGSRFGMVTGSIGICGFEHGIRQVTRLGLTGHAPDATE